MKGAKHPDRHGQLLQQLPTRLRRGEHGNVELRTLPCGMLALAEPAQSLPRKSGAAS